MRAEKKLVFPSADDLRQAQILWEYMFLKDEPTAADIIIVMGGHDLGVVNDAVALYKRGLAPKILFCGNVGRTTFGLYETSEAHVMKSLALQLGVADSDILVEDKSTNNQENIEFGQAILHEHGISPKKVILIHTPYMLMRDRATFLKHWDGTQDISLVCWAQDITFKDYLATCSDQTEEISIIVGDLHRLKVYFERGFQVEQYVPPFVWAAFDTLVASGYTKHLAR